MDRKEEQDSCRRHKARLKPFPALPTRRTSVRTVLVPLIVGTDSALPEFDSSMDGCMTLFPNHFEPHLHRNFCSNGDEHAPWLPVGDDLNSNDFITNPN